MSGEVKLSKAQLAGLKHIAEGGMMGPAPGWNALVWIENVCEGDDLSALVAAGLIVAEPVPPPHYEDFNEESGSITCDHNYRLTPAGRAALTRSQP